jgi:hypothetical protein
MVAASETNAGQLMKCPFCNESFSVPALPQPDRSMPLELPDDAPLTPAEVSPSPPQTADVHEDPVYKVVPEPPKPPPPRREPRPVPPPSPPSPVAQSPSPQHERTVQLRINAEYLPWVAPIALGIAFLLLFFPWVGAYPGGYGVYTQRGIQALWGGFSLDPVGDKVLGLQKQIDDNIAANWFRMTLYFLLILAALAIVIWPIVQARGGFRVPPGLEALKPWRSTLLVAILLVALVFLLMQFWSGFGLEEAITAPIDARLAKDQSAAQTQEEIEIRRAQQLGALGLRRTAWLRWEVFFLLVALTAASLGLWLERRPDQPLPHAELHW